MRLELLEHVRLELGVAADRAEDLPSLRVRRLLDEVGELCRMEAGELRVRNPQPHGRHVPGERLHRRPVEERARADPCARAAAARARRSRPRTPVSTPTTRYQPSSRASSISFERTSRAPSTLMSCRSRTSFFRSTSRARRSNGCRSSRRARSVTRPWSSSRDRVRGHEHLPSGHGPEEARDRRVLLAAEADDEIVDAPELRPLGVEQVAAGDERQVEHARDRGGGRFHADNDRPPRVEASVTAPSV